MMPNLKPPVTTMELAVKYRSHIQQSISNPEQYPHFEPLMVLYLTDRTTPEEIHRAAERGIVGCKYYPAGATTNSDAGVSDIKLCYPALRAMDELNMMLCIHSEVTHGDIFEREPIFIEEIIKPLVADFPHLKITMEHISTKEAVDYILSAPETVKASITCHHLLFNRNRTLTKYKHMGGICDDGIRRHPHVCPAHYFETDYTRYRKHMHLTCSLHCLYCMTFFVLPF